jgi:hypothetical protein
MNIAGAIVQIPSKSIQKSSSDFGTKNAWAQIVRRRFNGQNLVKACMAEWHLSEGQARGLVYASVTQPTIDQIIKRNPVEGFALSLEVAALVTGVHLENFIHARAQGARNEQARAAAEERSWASLQARRAELRLLDRDDDRSPG